MKRLIILFVFPLFLNGQVASKKIRTLFIGNSYTYVNNLPLLVYNLALSNGDTLVYDSYCPGGYTFNGHSNDASTLAKISLGNWDYVVLQAQSQEPSFSPTQVNAQTLPYAIKLDSLIKHYNTCAHTVFYETWGRKNGDAANCPSYPPVCTYAGMQNRLRDSYRMFADTVDALMAPVGEAFRLAIASNTVIDLYQTDQSHPSLEGSYLASAVFYETLFQKTVLTGTYNPGLPGGTVSFLNQIAHQLVTDSAVITNIPKYIPKVTFSVMAQSSSSFQFQSGVTGFTHQWYFGDGTTSSLVNPNHSYAGSGNYTVSLVVKNADGCELDSVSSVVQATVVTVGIKENGIAAISLYPNPCKEHLIISARKNFEHTGSIVEIYSITGQLVFSGLFAEQINTTSLKNGIYYIKISNASSISNSCFIKNE